MGLWDRIRGVGKGGYRARAAHKLELAGELEAAARTYATAGLPDEAARLLLRRADAEPSFEKRMVLFERAAETAADEELARKARARGARLAYDLARSRGAAMRGEVLAAAEALEAAQEHELAAEAYKLLGDAEGEVRALTAAGAIDRLEERLTRAAAASKQEQAHGLALRRVADHDRSGERRKALEIAAEALAHGPDERLEDLVRVIRLRLVRGPTWEATLGDEAVTLAFGDRVTIGRGEATIVVASRSVSREHVAVRRDEEGRAVVEDLGTRNGTFLGGARLGAPVPVGQGVSLTLGPDLACRVSPHVDGGVVVDVAGVRYVAPLGPLLRAGWRITAERHDGEGFVVLESSASAPAYFGALLAGPRAELAAGDAVSRTRGGPPELRVGGGAAR